MPPVLVAALAVTAVAIAACEEEPDAAGRAKPAAARDVVLGCANRVERAPGLPVFDPRQDVAAGPVVFHGLKGEARRARKRPRQVARRYREGEGAVKVLAGVKAAARPTVTIAPSGRASAGLVYGTSPDPRTPRDSLDMAERAVEFQACPRRTYFAGGFLIAEAHCMRLLVSTPGHATRRFVLPYGVPTREPARAPRPGRPAPAPGRPRCR